jgi:hypothetical protein
VKLAHPLLASLLVLAAAAPAAAQQAGKPADAALAPLRTDTPVPQHYPPPIVRLELIGVGLLITGGAWGASFASAANWPTVPGSDQLKIPVLGPWIALGKSGCATDDPNCSSGTIGMRGAIYVLDGIAQLAGLGLIVEAIVMKTETPSDKRKASIFGLRAGSLELRPTPIATPTMHGVGYVGRF